MTARAPLPLSNTPTLRHMLLIAGGAALIWWIIGVLLYGVPYEESRIYVWGDQAWTFTKAPNHLSAPYTLSGFVNPPWVLLILTPTALLPFALSMLAQMLIYFLALAAVVYKFGGKRMEIALLLASPLALNTAIELNIDWIVVLALLVPPAYSAPLLLAKPQNALGYVLGFTWRQLVRWVLVLLVLLLASFIVWGDWLNAWLASAERYPVAITINVAPRAIIGLIPALISGVVLAVIAVRRRDLVIGVLAGVFFIPYIAGYSVLLHFGLIMARWRRVGWVLWLALWIVVLLIGALFYGWIDGLPV